MSDRGRFEAGADALLGPGRLLRQHALAPHTTFRVGGPAEWFAEVVSAGELVDLVALAHACSVPVTILGGGSNVVIADAGVPGLVIHPRLSAIRLERGGRVVRAEAGATINGLVRWTVGRGLAGLEAWAGTPGTVGGAISGNAHWRHRDIGGVVSFVMLLNGRGETAVVPAAEMDFAYDTSRIQRTHEIVVWADFDVTRAPAEDLRGRARESLAYRKQTQPLAMPTAGCIFQNPDPAREAVPAGVPASAGALIDRAGLKGRRVGGAVISPTHANFIVNDGGATAADIRTLIEEARAAVRDRFGVELRDEVVYLGTF